jgi:4-amino-4-deoxy-L-arabinose transferase-like glycosyltransferase
MPLKYKQKNNFYRNVAILLGLSVLVEFLVYVSTLYVFHSFVDQWGFKVYFETIIIPFVSNGSLPYINYFWEYPVIMVIPVFVAAIPSMITREASIFFVAFPAIMIICNLITTLLIYLITMNIYRNETRAFVAGFLYATSIAAAYITITNFDPLPTMFVMLGICCTIYGGTNLKYSGYFWYIIGFFTKIYSIAILPFLVLFNAKKTTIKEECITVVKVGILPFLILFVPIYILNPASINTYLITNAAGKEIFVDSFVYTVYAWLHEVFHIPVSVALVSLAMTILLAVVIGTLVYLAYIRKSQDKIFLLKVTLVALVAIIAFSKYHSPQYMLWIMPILCILVAGDLLMMGIYYLLQAIWFIKFPLIFWSVYTNNEYTNAIPSSGGYLALLFFTVEYAVLFYLVFATTTKGVRNVSQ